MVRRRLKKVTEIDFTHPAFSPTILAGRGSSEELVTGNFLETSSKMTATPCRSISS